MVRPLHLRISAAIALGASVLLSAGTVAAQDASPAPGGRTNLLPPPPDGAPAGTAPAAPPNGTAAAAPNGAASTTPAAPPPPANDKPKKPEPAADGSIGTKPSDVYGDEWWGRTRPALEIHGYFRTRAELFHNFTLGRVDGPGSEQYLWPQPLDNSYTDANGVQHSVNLCGDSGTDPCTNNTQAGANLRFRIAPELHISDSLRIYSQIDALDNLVLGSTPDVYAMKPNVGGTGDNGSGYTSAGYNGYAPLSGFASTQGPPTAGVNGYRNSIDVKRAWAEFMTPLGQLRFGRMPNNWGLGILANPGDGIDSDYQSTNDRIMFVTGIKSIDLYFAGMWDFVNTGPNTSSPYDVFGGQPYNTSNLNNVNQWGLAIARRTNPEAAKLTLARGGLVLNGGLFTILRTQYLDTTPGSTPLTTDSSGNTAANGFERRDAWAVIPDLWIQALYKKFRFEAEGVAIIGQAKIPSIDGKNATLIRQFGFAAQTEYLAVEDKLHLNFGFGWASGDPWVEGLNPGPSGLQPEKNGAGPISTFHFHPDYRVDLIFFRRILTRVEGAYYFRPSVDYDFLKNSNGQKFGGGAALIWSRASEPIQSPGNKPDLGVELDLQLYYQAKDGALNDDPKKIGGFYTMLQYGVFFPLGGLDYLPTTNGTTANPNFGNLSAAQTVRWYIGVVY